MSQLFNENEIDKAQVALQSGTKVQVARDIGWMAARWFGWGASTQEKPIISRKGRVQNIKDTYFGVNKSIADWYGRKDNWWVTPLYMGMNLTAGAISLYTYYNSSSSLNLDKDSSYSICSCALVGSACLTAVARDYQLSDKPSLTDYLRPVGRVIKGTTQYVCSSSKEIVTACTAVIGVGLSYATGNHQYAYGFGVPLLLSLTSSLWNRANRRFGFYSSTEDQPRTLPAPKNS